MGGTNGQAVDAAAPAVVVSCDSHVGPRLSEDLRDYCPKRYLQQYDEMVEEEKAAKAAMKEMFDRSGGARGAALATHRNMTTAGHYDPHVRLREMDIDGVAAEAMWHFSQNGENMPWVGLGLGTVPDTMFELGSVSYDIYNRWLADFCSVDPDRLLGLVYIPSWDIPQSIKVLEQFREKGLHVINFPAASRPGVKDYNQPDWDPFWAAVQDLGYTLSIHSGGGPLFDFYSGRGGLQIQIYEGGGYMSRRALWHMIYGEVFERFPQVKLVVTEQYEGWYVPTMLELDAITMTFGIENKGLPRQPSEYMRSNVYLGASFMSTFQAEEAVAEHYVDNLLWGRDYPHVEGVWQAPDDPDDEPITKLALRYVLSRVSTTDALKIAGENAVQVFNLDGQRLAKVAAEIGAPTGADLAEPVIGDLPTVYGSNAFVGQAGPRPLEPERIARAEARRAGAAL
jgi:predicted TIM-barrel fold metal-dependent hydrolase